MTVTTTYRLILGALVIAVFAVLLGWRAAPGMAQEVDKHANWKVIKAPLRNNKDRSKDNEKFKNDPEKIIEDQIPRHLPIKVEFRGLDKEPFLNNFEMVVTNTGSKPIYEMYFVLIFPQAKKPELNGTASIPLSFGDLRLVDFHEPLNDTNVSLKPGETTVLKIEPKYAEGLQQLMRSIGSDELDLRRGMLIFQNMNHGDGTGYFSNEGTDKVPHRK
ncbi:MAG: hypothetical protein QOH96_3582 [Blastocatellia bacterium]|nr:hypothetical protein [Blastocatellia bacterium]